MTRLALLITYSDIRHSRLASLGMRKRYMARNTKVLHSLTVAFMALGLLPSLSQADQSRDDVMKAHRGGTVRLIAKSAGGTLDQIGRAHV